MVRSLRVFVLVAGTLVASRVGADPTTDRARALELFGQSDKAYKAGDLENAAALLRRAYAIYPEPILLYNLARALEGMGATQDAIDQYEKYLATDPHVKDRGAIERRVATMREQLAAQAANQHVTVERTSETPQTSSKLAFATIGVGIATIAAGFEFGHLATTRHDQAVAEPVQTSAQSLQDRAQTYATTANVLFIAGAAVAVGGIVWTLIDHRHHDAIALRIGPSYAGVAWAFP